jgi:Ca2+-binding RTX toxin-like protein
MTYNDVSANNYVPNTYSYSGFLETLGAFDIAAVQYLYGPNISKNIGNNIYPLNESDLNGWNCIWDNGGTDVISAESALTSVTINLNNASLKNELGGGGYISQVGSKSYGYTIAFNSTGNCIIENAIGSDFNDKLIGNNFSNVLSGGDGNDRLFGRRGLDELFGGYSNDRLSGGAHNDLLNGGEGRDTLKGGLGNDSLTGGGGKDKFLLEANKGQDIITDYTSGEDKIKLLGGLAQSDLIIRQVEGDVKINYEGSLLAIIQNTIADDLTFI